MIAIAALAMGVQVLVCTVAGVRLLVRAARQRGIPEAGFGFCFLALGAIGYPVSLAARNGLASSPELAGHLLLVGLAAQNLACLALFIATWRVFRPQQPAAAAATLLAAVAFAASLVGQHLTVGFAGAADGGAFYWIGFLPRAAAFAWSAAESFRYFGLMRRRVALGLGDPVVSDRFRLWGAASAQIALAFLVFGAARVLGVHPATSPPVVLITSVCAFGCSATLWLAFFPPAAYLARMRASA